MTRTVWRMARTIMRRLLRSMRQTRLGRGLPSRSMRHGRADEAFLGLTDRSLRRRGDRSRERMQRTRPELRHLARNLRHLCPTSRVPARGVRHLREDVRQGEERGPSTTDGDRFLRHRSMIL